MKTRLLSIVLSATVAYASWDGLAGLLTWSDGS